MGGFLKPGIAYSCNFFPKDGLFHKILVLSLMGFCTGCCNLHTLIKVFLCCVNLQKHSDSVPLLSIQEQIFVSENELMQ